LQEINEMIETKPWLICLIALLILVAGVAADAAEFFVSPGDFSFW